MTEQQFCYWLQGFAELSGDCPPTPEQWKSIREHLALCFKKVTPPVGKPATKMDEQQGKEFADALERLKKEGAKSQPAEAWPPIQQWPQHPYFPDSGKVTITC